MVVQRLRRLPARFFPFFFPFFAFLFPFLAFRFPFRFAFLRFADFRRLVFRVLARAGSIGSGGCGPVGGSGARRDSIRSTAAAVGSIGTVTTSGACSGGTLGSASASPWTG